jgi:hypothetical protein
MTPLQGQAKGRGADVAAAWPGAALEALHEEV